VDLVAADIWFGVLIPRQLDLGRIGLLGWERRERGQGNEGSKQQKAATVRGAASRATYPQVRNDEHVGTSF
jgi:hypothetical protein